MQLAKVTKISEFSLPLQGMRSKRFSPWGDLAAMAGLLMAATLVSVACMAAIRLAAPDMEYGALNFTAYVLQFSLAVALGALWLRRRGTDHSFRFTFRWFDGPLVLLGVVLVAAAGVVIEPLLMLFPERYFDRLAEMIGSGGWAILLTVVAAPVLEELFFRGLVLERLSRAWSAPAAVTVSALLFGAVHLPNLPQMVNAFVMAVVMGYIYLAGRSLIPVIVIHAINNGVAYLVLELTGTQSTDTREMIADETLYRIIYAVSAVILIVSLVRMDASVRNKNDKISLHKKTADDPTR
jgi:membrane protease YdiL (CAAX protease family)